MPSYRLVTIDRVELSGPLGPATLAEPRHLAMLVRLAAAPGRVLESNELLLTIWPHLTPRQGAAELAAAAAAIAAAAGSPLVTSGADRWALDPAIDCDLDRADPGSAGGFAAGLTLPDTPEWDEWVTTVRAGLASRPAPKRPGRRVGRIVALAAIALVAVLGYRFARAGPLEGFAPGDRVILADIDNATTDTALGRSLRVAAAVGLLQSTRIELVPRSQVVGSLGAAGPDDRDPLVTAERALEVAARSVVPWVVAIRVAPEGGRSRVTTRLLRAGTGEVVFTASRGAAGILDVVAAVGGTIRALLERLGEPAGTLRDQPALAFATTSDLDALRAYAEGTAAWSRGAFALAGDYWRRAITLDTGFAMAMGSLGGYYYYHHDRVAGERYYREALARRGRLTEWEWLQIEERYAGWRGDQDSALALARSAVARFPRSGTYFSLGTNLLQAGRCAEALEPLERSRQLDPRNPNTHINIATCYRRLGRYEPARLAYRAAGRVDSTALYRGNVNLEYAGIALLAGQVAEAESALTRMTGRPGMNDQALGFRGLGYLAFWRGEVARAREQFRRAAELSRQQRANNSRLRNLVLVATLEQAGGQEAAARRSIRELDSLARLPSMPPAFLGLAAEPHAAAADAAGLRALLDLVRERADPRSRSDSVLVHYLTGSHALAAGEARAALAAFDRAQGYVYPVTLALHRAEALERLGELDRAHAELGGIAGRPAFGSEEQIAWTRALIAIGRVEERLNRFDDAVASYRRFLAHWQNADPGLPDVTLARGRLDALLSRRDRPAPPPG